VTPPAGAGSADGAGPAGPAAPAPARAAGGEAPNARGRILDAALTLVSELGSAGTSMRRLASACGLNVATIYHYFPSKADLLRALVAERRYGERMATDRPPLDATLAPGPRLAALVRWVAEATLAEETVLRLLVGEGMRGEATARQSAAELLATTDATMTAWLTAGFPELAERGPSPAGLAVVLRTALLGAAIEYLATGSTDIEALADHLATTTFG
jgi:AcrR family transcriptional regulator